MRRFLVILALLIFPAAGCQWVYAFLAQHTYEESNNYDYFAPTPQYFPPKE